MWESLRIALIKWNVAPLGIVVFLCAFMWQIGKPFMGTGCQEGADATIAGAILMLLGTVGGILYKMFDRIQANRGGPSNELEKDTD